MKTHRTALDERRVQTAIDFLDLGPIKVKLTDTHEGAGWPREQANLVEQEYRRFLFLMWKHGDGPIVPTSLVDQFWHQHILDTRKYADDCQSVFGEFLHHFPYFGMRGEEDAANLQSAFAQTMSLFEREFGVPPQTTVAGASDCDTCGAGSCGHDDPWCSTCSGKVKQPHLRPSFV